MRSRYIEANLKKSRVARASNYAKIYKKISQALRRRNKEKKEPEEVVPDKVDSFFDKEFQDNPNWPPEGVPSDRPIKVESDFYFDGNGAPSDHEDDAIPDKQDGDEEPDPALGQRERVPEQARLDLPEREDVEAELESLGRDLVLVNVDVGFNDANNVFLPLVYPIPVHPGQFFYENPQEG